MAHQYTKKGFSLGARNDQSNLPSLAKIELHLSDVGNRHLRRQNVQIINFRRRQNALSLLIMVNETLSRSGTLGGLK